GRRLGSVLLRSARTTRRLDGPSRNSGHLLLSRVRASWWPDGIWNQAGRHISPGRDLHWPDSQRCETGRPADPAVHENRADYQLEDCPDAWANLPGHAARRRGDSVTPCNPRVVCCGASVRLLPSLTTFDYFP